jgi:hypothetical protein
LGWLKSMGCLASTTNANSKGFTFTIKWNFVQL